MPLATGVPIPFFAQFINDAGVFVPNEQASKGAAAMMAELKRWTPALKQMRSA
jgi:hypothetical protein